MTFTHEQILAILLKGHRHGDYDDDFRDGSNAALDWVRKQLDIVIKERTAHDQS